MILGNFNERWARLIFCEAHRLEMFGGKYQWIIMGTYGYEWWKRDDDYTEANCTVENLEEALQQTILTDLLPLSTSGEITISGIVSHFIAFRFQAFISYRSTRTAHRSPCTAQRVRLIAHLAPLNTYGSSLNSQRALLISHR